MEIAFTYSAFQFMSYVFFMVIVPFVIVHFTHKDIMRRSDKFKDEGAKDAFKATYTRAKRLLNVLIVVLFIMFVALGVKQDKTRETKSVIKSFNNEMQEKKPFTKSELTTKDSVKKSFLDKVDN